MTKRPKRLEKAHSVQYYFDLPYTIEFVRNASDVEHPVWFATVRELRGCMTEADDFDEAGRQIRDAMQAWIEDVLEAGDAIPEPKGEEAFSGKFSVRLPRSLHRDLVHRAEREGVSLNQSITAVLSRSIKV